MSKAALQSLDPRSKMMMMFCLSTLAIFFARPSILLAVLLFCLFLLFICRIPLLTLTSRIKPLLCLMLTLFIIQCAFVRSGEPLLSLGSFVLITAGGLDRALSMVLRLMILVCSAILLVSGRPEIIFWLWYTAKFLMKLLLWLWPLSTLFPVATRMPLMFLMQHK